MPYLRISYDQLAIFSFPEEVLLARGSLHGKWENKKFRFMYLLRCILNPVASVQYYYKLLSLQSIDKLLEIHPTLPAKSIDLIYIKEDVHIPAGSILSDIIDLFRVYRINIRRFYFRVRQYRSFNSREKMVSILIFSVLHATLTVKGN